MRYAKNWSEIAETVKCIAGWRCGWCGHTDDKESGYLLTVHHLDGNTENNDLENLIALCQRCHLRAQAKLRAGWAQDPRQMALPGLELAG